MAPNAHWVSTSPKLACRPTLIGCAISQSACTNHNFFLLSGASSVGKQNIYSSGCSNNRITLECPDYHKIAIKRLFYGVKNDTRCAGKGREHSPDCCQPTHNDCLVVDDLKYPSLNMLCSGHRGCDIEAESIRSGTSCRANGYGEATDYMSVIHDCIPGKYLAI